MRAVGDLPVRQGVGARPEVDGAAPAAPPRGARAGRRRLGTLSKRSRRVRRAGALAVAGVLAAAAAGCGEESFGHSHVVKEHARAAVETWLGACANEDTEVVTEVLIPQTRELIFTAPSVIGGCARIARLGLPPDADTKELEELFETAHVEHVEVAAGFGTAVVRSAKGATSELQLELDAGRWTLSNPPLVP